MIKLKILDWSGVISDDTKPVYEANMMLLEDCGKARISFEEWRKLSNLTAAGFLRNCGVDADEKQTYETYKKYFNQLVNIGNEPKIISGADAAVRALRRKSPLVVLSSHPESNLKQEMQRYSLSDCFQMIYGSARDKTKGLSEICDGLGISRRDALYIGDTIHDIQAAKQAGLKSGAVCTGYHDAGRLNEERPDYLKKNLSEFTGIC